MLNDNQTHTQAQTNPMTATHYYDGERQRQRAKETEKMYESL